MSTRQHEQRPIGDLPAGERDDTPDDNLDDITPIRTQDYTSTKKRFPQVKRHVAELLISGSRVRNPDGAPESSTQRSRWSTKARRLSRGGSLAGTLIRPANRTCVRFRTGSLG